MAREASSRVHLVGDGAGVRIVIDTRRDPAEVALEDPDDFRAFDVLLRGPGDPLAALAIVGTSQGGGGNVFIERDRLMQLAGSRAGDPVWLQGLEGMLSYAEQHGWVDGDGKVRAHVVRG